MAATRCARDDPAMRSIPSRRPGSAASGCCGAASRCRVAAPAGRLAIAVAAALVALGTLGAGSARAEAIHCGRSVVAPGDRAAEVLRKCGAPTRRQSLKSAGGPPTHGGRSGAGSPSARSGRTGTRPAKAGAGRTPEVWTYDLGSRQLVRFLTFERGRLVRIDLGGYGR
jgi:hypothetical protein